MYYCTAESLRIRAYYQKEKEKRTGALLGSAAAAIILGAIKTVTRTIVGDMLYNHQLASALDD